MPEPGSNLPPPARSRGGGLRREASILLPVSLLLFAALACITVVAYRAAIFRLVEERRAVALRQAALFAERASSRPDAALEVERWRETLPPGVSIAIFDERGARLAASGLDPDQPLPAVRVPNAAALAGPSVEGPGGGDGASEDAIVAWAPYVPRGAPADGRPALALVRVASPEPSLAAELRTLRILTPAVFVLSAAVAALAISFLYALNRPVAALLERARELPPAAAGALPSPRGGDETDFLLAAFDRALAALRASDGDPSGGARRDAEERLAQTVAELGELSAGVAHELRNSLGTLQGYLGLLARRELPAAAREEVAEARSETEALARVVDDFLAFARPELGTVETIDLVALVDRALADPSLAGATFRRDYGVRSVPVHGSERLLRRALRNLLLNATQAQAAAAVDAPIEIAIHEPESGFARVAIRDHGAGLDPAVAGRLFAPFASGRTGGAGLGLALSRRIVLLHHGRIALADAPGGGAVASLSLPLVEPESS